MSANGIRLLIELEGNILHGYLDAVRILTIGVGHVVLKNEPYKLNEKITKAESEGLLRKDLRRFENAVNSSVIVPVTQNQFDCLCIFSFNVGVSAFRRSSVLKNLNNRKFTAAADALLLWNKAGGKVLTGLTRRRKTERELFLTPDKVSISTVFPAAAGSGNSTHEFSQSAVETPAGKTLSTPVRGNSADNSNTGAGTEKTATATIEKQDGLTAKVSTTELNQQDVSETEKIENSEKYNQKGFWQTVKSDFYKLFGVNATVQTVAEYGQTAQTTVPPSLLEKLAYLIAVGSICYLIFRIVHYFVDQWRKKERERLIAEINTDISRKNVEFIN